MKKYLIILLLVGFAGVATAEDWAAFDLKGTASSMGSEMPMKIDKEKLRALIVVDAWYDGNGPGFIVWYGKGYVDVDEAELFMPFYDWAYEKGVTSMHLDIDDPGDIEGTVVAFGRYKNKYEWLSGFSGKAVGVGWDEADGVDIGLKATVRFNRKLTAEMLEYGVASEDDAAWVVAGRIADKAKMYRMEVYDQIMAFLDQL